MFADSLLESAPHLEHRSAWTKLASVFLQSLALAVALAIPLFHVERLQFVPPPPSIQMTTLQQPVMSSQPARSSYSNAPALPDQLVQPNYIPSQIVRGDGKPREQGGDPFPGIPCVGNCGSPDGALANILIPGPVIIGRTPQPPPVHPIHVSEMQLGSLIRKVLPEYPTIAKQMRLQGSVVLTAIIGKDGRVERVQSVSGPPLLVLPAKRAVEQWQYRPYLLNHEPVEVQTQITVNFVMNRD